MNPRVPLANLDGQVLPLADAKISVLDRGFLFGDAVYEVLRVYQGRPWLEPEHFARLAQSLSSIRIQGIDVARLRQRMHQTITAGSFQEAVVYMQITRGAAPRNHHFPTSIKPLEFLFVQEFTDPYGEARERGTRVILQPDIRWDRCDIKSTNLLANVLAIQSAKEAGCPEAIFYLPDGTLTEGTHTSLFGVLDGSLLTAPKSGSILPGITRQLVLRLAARAGVPVREQALNRRELGGLAELFVTGTTSEIMPVVAVDDMRIGSGQPGVITRRLQQAYREEVTAFLQS